MKPALVSLGLAAATLITGCASLNHREVIDIANRAAEREGYHLEEYKKPTAQYEIGRGGKKWSVFYDGKVPIPGNHFSVEIDDATGEAKVLPGL